MSTESTAVKYQGWTVNEIPSTPGAWTLSYNVRIRPPWYAGHGFLAVGREATREPKNGIRSRWPGPRRRRRRHQPPRTVRAVGSARVRPGMTTAGRAAPWLLLLRAANQKTGSKGGVPEAAEGLRGRWRPRAGGGLRGSTRSCPALDGEQGVPAGWQLSSDHAVPVYPLGPGQLHAEAAEGA